jgi:AAA domain
MNAVSRSRLKAIPPKAAEPSKPKVLIFGKPGVGKTWSSLDFPSCYYIDTEGGANLRHYTEKLANSGGAYMGPEQGSTDFSTVLEQIQALGTEQHDFRTLVIDSVSHVFNTEIAAMQDSLARENKKDEYGASRKPAISLMRRAVMWLDRLDMNVVLIAHAKDEYGINAKGDREVIGSTFDCWDKLEYILHLALLIEKRGPSRTARVRKTRLLGFPDADTFQWSFDEFADRYGRDIIEGAVKQIVVATPEQVAEFSAAFAKVKMPDDWLEKCLRRGKAERIEDLDTTAIDAMITMLRNRAVED